MKTYPNCTSTIFKTDIKDLCINCPLKDIIMNGIKEQILTQASERRGILSHPQFEKYINSEIENASKSMEQTFLTEKQNIDYKSDPYRRTRIKNYIWNKERIKALNQFLKTKPTDNPNLYPRIFKKPKGYLILRDFSENIINELADYSFIYWSMQKDNLIFEDIKPKPFVEWLNKEFNTDIDKLKQLNICTTKNKLQLYSMIKDRYKSQ